jgi:hypothetical protein
MCSDFDLFFEILFVHAFLLLLVIGIYRCQNIETFMLISGLKVYFRSAPEKFLTQKPIDLGTWDF